MTGLLRPLRNYRDSFCSKFAKLLRQRKFDIGFTLKKALFYFYKNSIAFTFAELKVSIRLALAKLKSQR